MWELLESESEPINLLIEFPELVYQQLINPGIQLVVLANFFYLCTKSSGTQKKHFVIIILCNACANQTEKTFVIIQIKIF